MPLSHWNVESCLLLTTEYRLHCYQLGDLQGKETYSILLGGASNILRKWDGRGYSLCFKKYVPYLNICIHIHRPLFRDSIIRLERGSKEAHI